MMPERYLAVHPEAGIFLGECMGMGFWTKCDPAGLDLAVTFASPEDLQVYINMWNDQLPGVEAARVITKDAVYATIAECVEAGCEPWDPKWCEEAFDTP